MVTMVELLLRSRVLLFLGVFPFLIFFISLPLALLTLVDVVEEVIVSVTNLFWLSLLLQFIVVVALAEVFAFTAICGTRFYVNSLTF